MASTRRKDRDKSKGRPPATTVEGRENQLVSLAVDLAEQQMREGTASAQVISHYLKLGSTREQLEQERLANENQLLRARVEQLQSSKRIEELYDEAINAMKRYAGHDDYEEIEYDGED